MPGTLRNPERTWPKSSYSKGRRLAGVLHKAFQGKPVAVKMASIEVSLILSSPSINFKIYSLTGYKMRNDESALSDRYTFCLKDKFIQQIGAAAEAQNLLPTGEWKDVVPITKPSEFQNEDKAYLSVRLDDGLDWKAFYSKAGSKFFKGPGLDALLVLPGLTRTVKVPTDALLEAIRMETVGRYKAFLNLIIHFLDLKACPSL